MSYLAIRHICRQKMIKPKANIAFDKIMGRLAEVENGGLDCWPKLEGFLGLVCLDE